MEFKDIYDIGTYNIMISQPGWCTDAKRLHAYNWIKSNTPQLIVEIGVYGGSFLYPMAYAAPFAKCVGIDPWSHEACLEGMTNEANKQFWGKDVNISAIEHQARLGITKLNLHNVELIKDYSHLVADKFEDNSIDILSIDGNHSLEPCRRDCLLYLPKVKVNGVIYLDDWGWTEDNVDTVRPSYYWLLEQGCEDIGEVDGCKVLRKNK